jgi:predicted metalloprotease with PDZ domain
MENPNRHYIHVEMTCTNQHDDFIELKMPVWTPGYYGIQNNSKHLTGFKAVNGEGKTVAFSKTTKNSWKVNTRNQQTVVVSYDVYASELSVVGSFLDASKAFISPTSVYLFPDGKIGEPSRVTFKPLKAWKSISTGLDKIEGSPNTYFASDFDVLFDCPTLLGNQQEIPFSVKGVRHTLAVSEKDTLDKKRFISDLTKIVETATSLMGDIPYEHYSFITLGSHGGGMEHGNSCALSCSGSVANTSNMTDYKDWLAFVTHEYFHLFNVKRIRPVTLGPFDYDRECYTNMLWVSEGFTVYYEYLILNRAGIFTKDDCYNYFTQNITGYENRPGHLMESATGSGFDAWIHFFERNAENRNNTISYYDKGCALGLLLDLKIRHATSNQKSLDDVMRTLYNSYHKAQKRGFTDDEFRSVCEKTAGIALDEIFNYASTVNPIDYPNYLSLAGLAIDTAAHVVENKVYFGATPLSDKTRCWLSGVVRNSPAWNAGLGNDIEVLTVDGQKASKESFESVLNNKKAGDTLQLTITVDEKVSDVQVVLTPKVERRFTIEENKNATDKQKALRKMWLY